MDNLFTVISIVMANCGATYTCINALRTWLGGRVTESLASSKNIAENLSKDNEQGHCLGEHFWKSQKHSKKLASWKRKWDWSFGVPVLLFVLLAYGMAIHILIAYWTSPTVDGKAWWPIYRWLIGILLIANSTSVGVTIAAWLSICRHTEEMESISTASLQAKAKTLEIQNRANTNTIEIPKKLYLPNGSSIE